LDIGYSKGFKHLVSAMFHDATLTPQELHKAYFP